MNKFMAWRLGRQNSGYSKMLLFALSWPIKCDLYLLKFPEGSKVLAHKDEISKGKHYRINFILRKAKEGGIFKCEKCIYESSRVKLFRPDANIHEVSEIIKGSRYLLSIGWIRR